MSLDAMNGVKLTTLVVIAIVTIYIGSCKSNYDTITTTTDPLRILDTCINDNNNN